MSFEKSAQSQRTDQANAIGFTTSFAASPFELGEYRRAKHALRISCKQLILSTFICGYNAQPAFAPCIAVRALLCKYPPNASRPEFDKNTVLNPNAVPTLPKKIGITTCVTLRSVLYKNGGSEDGCLGQFFRQKRYRRADYKGRQRHHAQHRADGRSRQPHRVAVYGHVKLKQVLC